LPPPALKLFLITQRREAGGTIDVYSDIYEIRDGPKLGPRNEAEFIEHKNH
jgi:hypothetical protein